MMSLAVGYMGGTTASQLKKESTALAAAIRYSYHQAAITNLPYRIVFDMTDQAYWLEEGSGPFVLGKEEEKKEEAKKKGEKKGEAKAGEGDAASDGKEEASAEAEEAGGEETSFAREESVIKKVVFKDEIRIRDVYVSHQDDILTNGQSFLYFFPHGITERSVIHLSDEEGEHNMTLVVNPVTGKTKIENGYLEQDKLDEE